MDETATIELMENPNTRQSLIDELKASGIMAGSTLLVHASLSALGWVSGGGVAVVQALMDVVSPVGTLVMPEHSGDLSDPSFWQHPPVPENWWQIIRDTIPAYHPAYTPTRKMGVIAEIFRTVPGVIRSDHPAVSFAAWGKNAEFVTKNHVLEYSLGEGSPLARIYDLNGQVLLLGVGFGNNTSFHLSEARANLCKLEKQGAPILLNGERQWVEYSDFAYEDQVFEQIGEEFSKTGLVKKIRIGGGDSYLFEQKPAVDFAVSWLINQSSNTFQIKPQ